MESSFSRALLIGGRVKVWEDYEDEKRFGGSIKLACFLLLMLTGDFIKYDSLDLSY